MEIVSVSPLRVASLLWQTGPSAFVLTVVCKATYVLAPGESSLADEQDAPTDADAYWNDDPARSLHAPSDLAPLKTRADLVLVGSAYAPGGVPARRVVARLTVGNFDKAIECWADRVVAGDGSVQEGSGFTRMPLLYERAAGGPGTWNPAGVRRDARDGYGRLTLPNLQPPGTRIAGRDTAIEPIGFGPIAPRWPQRLERLGRHAGSWPPADWRSRPMPADLDPAYYNAAPVDQQLPGLRDNERIVLENLHHEHARLATTLLGVRPCAFVEGRPGTPARLPMRADTLRIDTDRGIANMVWRRQVPLEHPEEEGRVIVAMELPGQTFAWADVEAMAPVGDDKLDIETIPPPAGAPSLEREERTSAALRVPGAASLPFAASAPAPAPAPATASKPATPPTVPPARPQTQTLIFAGSSPRGDTGLPFQAAPSSTGGPPAGISSPWATSQRAAAPATASSVEAAAPLLVESEPRTFTPPPPAPAPSSASVITPAMASPWAAGASAPSFAKTAAPVAPIAPPAGPVARPEVIAPAAPRGPASDVLELLWFEGDSVPRMRRNKAWKPILLALEQRPVDRDLDDPALAAEPMEMEDRRESFEILAQGTPADASGIDGALEAAVRPDGKFVAQLALLAGELEFHFDELETLKATVATVAPFVTPSDEALKTAVESAKEFLKTADELTPPTVAEGMTARIRDAFAKAARAVPDTHLAEQTDRVLLAQRRYRKRIVFGGPHLRCLLHTDGTAVPTYLPESLAKKLPMYQRFRARFVAEVHQQADQYEAHHAALRAVALARATPRRSRG